MKITTKLEFGPLKLALHN